MKTLTVRLPEELAREIETESRERGRSKSDVVRERLSAPKTGHVRAKCLLDAIGDVIGSVDGLPPDLSARTSTQLKSSGYGANRSR